MSNQKPDSFLQKFYLHPTHLFKSETMPKQFYVEKVEKKKQLFTEKVNDILHGKSHFFSIRPINRVQSQALNSEIKCEKKGIMNK